MKKKLITVFLCTTTILSGCAGQGKQNYQDKQEIATIDFDNSIQNSTIQNNESEQPTESQKHQEYDLNSDTLENDRNTESTISTETSENQSQEIVGNTQKYETALDLYTGFLKDEVPVIIASDYPQKDYKTYNLEPGKSYTFATLGEFVNTSYLDAEHSTRTSYDYAQYTYLDCPNSDGKNLLVKFSGLGIYAPDDDSYAVYVITEKNGQLYLTDSYECWARNYTNACKNGLLLSEGSGGAGDHFEGIMALMANGKITDLYGAVILTGWWASYVSNDVIYNEVFAGSEDINFSVMIYTIGEQMYYTYDMSECANDQISICETYINRCHDEVGIEWVSGKIVEEAIRKQCEMLGIDYNAISQQEEAGWTEIQ